jgi:hypothetical protein
MSQNPGAAVRRRSDEGDRAMARMTRRRLLMGALPFGIPGFALARAARAAGSCVQPESEALRTSVNYVEPAADPAVACAHCAFFTADPAGGACGSCQILSGPVDATGHCDSFSAPT